MNSGKGNSGSLKANYGSKYKEEAGSSSLLSAETSDMNKSDVDDGAFSESSSVTSSYMKNLGISNEKKDEDSVSASSKHLDNASYREFIEPCNFNSLRNNNGSKKKERLNKYLEKDLAKHLNSMNEDNICSSNSSYIDEWLRDAHNTFQNGRDKTSSRQYILNSARKRASALSSSNDNNNNNNNNSSSNNTSTTTTTTTNNNNNNNNSNDVDPLNMRNLKGLSSLNIFPPSPGKGVDLYTNLSVTNRNTCNSSNNNNKLKLNSVIGSPNCNINNVNNNDTNKNATSVTNNAIFGSGINNYITDISVDTQENNHIFGSRNVEKELNDPSFFENMVSDLRLTFVNWLKKTQMIFTREKDKLLKDRKELELERQKVYKEIENKRILEEEKIQDERRKLDIDICNSYKQLKKEKEENRKRFDEERMRFLQEIDKMKLLLNLKKERYYQEYKKFEVEKKKIVDANIATETLIDINIGGVVFETSRHTLTQQKNSFIEQLLSGRHTVTRDKNGRIFLDRDSELFRIILNFLRNPLNVPVPKDLNESESLLKETEFYGINFFSFPLVFCVGGFDGVEYLNSVELLDINQQCWRMCTPMSTSKAYFGSAVLNNFLYIFGGNNYDYKALFETEVYDRLRNVWYLSSNLNVPRRNNSGVTLNGRIFCIGGYDGTSIIPNVEAYDHRMKAWVEVAPLNTPRSSAMCVAVDNKIYVIGGTNGERLKSIEVYDEKMNVWEKFPHDLLEARSSGSAFSYLNQIYVLGGVDNEHNILNSVEQYQSFNKRWQFLSNIPESKMNFAAATLSDSYIITGGENGGVLNSCYFFSPDTNEWQVGPPLLVPRFGHSVLVANL